MKCNQELCPSWTGEGCICEVVGVDALVVAVEDAEATAFRHHQAGSCHLFEWSCSYCEAEPIQSRESEGWASYAAEQERHAVTAARLADMTREARLSRESTEKAVQRLESLRNEIARLHDVYAVAPSEPRCCSDCAALDISDELRMVLRNA